MPRMIWGVNLTNGPDRPNSITYWLTSGNDREKFDVQSCSEPFMGYMSSSFDWRLSMDQLWWGFDFIELEESWLLYPRCLKVRGSSGSNLGGVNWFKMIRDPPRPPQTPQNQVNTTIIYAKDDIGVNLTNGTDRQNSITYWLTSGNDRENLGGVN